MRRTTALIATSALALGSFALIAPAASAKDGDVKARGACATPSSASWAVKVKPRKGVQRADFWVKGNATGQAWTFTLTQGGAPVGQPVTRTAGASDDQGADDTRHAAEVKFRTVVPAGAGQLVFRAVSADGQVCTATVG